jgi:hypothetical protein
MIARISGVNAAWSAGSVIGFVSSFTGATPCNPLHLLHFQKHSTHEISRRDLELETKQETYETPFPPASAPLKLSQLQASGLTALRLGFEPGGGLRALGFGSDQASNSCVIGSMG